MIVSCSFRSTNDILAAEKEIERSSNIEKAMNAIREHANDTINSHSKQGNTENTNLWYTILKREILRKNTTDLDSYKTIRQKLLNKKREVATKTRPI